METLFSEIAEQSGEKLASKGELAELRLFQGRWTAMRDQMLTFTDQNAKTAYLDHQKQVSKALESGKTEADSWTMADFFEDYAEKMESAKMAMRAITQETIPLATQVCERFCASANEFAAEAEKVEAAQHLTFAVAYRPSPLVEALKAAAAKARNRIPTGNPYANSSPAQMLPYLNLEN